VIYKPCNGETVIHTKTSGESTHHQTFHYKMECTIQTENRYRDLQMCHRRAIAKVNLAKFG